MLKQVSKRGESVLTCRCNQDAGHASILIASTCWSVRSLIKQVWLFFSFEMFSSPSLTLFPITDVDPWKVEL